MLIARASLEGTVTYGEVSDGRFLPFAGSPFEPPGQVGAAHQLDDVELLAPCEPRKVFVILGGFLPPDQAATPPGMLPMFTAKVTTAISGYGGTIVVPEPESSPVAEGELALVVGRTVDHASPAEAEAAIFGYTCFNDASLLRYMGDRDWVRAKCVHGLAAMGPWINTSITAVDIKDGLQIRTFVNGALQQEGNTENFKFPPAVVLSELSKYVTLAPGDVVSLGTPPPPAAVRSGDRVDIEIDQIGVLRSSIA